MTTETAKQNQKGAGPMLKSALYNTSRATKSRILII